MKPLKWPCGRRPPGGRLNHVEGCPSPITGKSVTRQTAYALTSFSNTAQSSPCTPAGVQVWGGQQMRSALSTSEQWPLGDGRDKMSCCL